jgi:predicted PurR-regulated permease PerM
MSSRGADILGGAASSIPGAAMALGVLVVSIYFLLIDGRDLIAFLRKNSFFTQRQTDQLFRRLESICRSVMLASLVAGISQAVFQTLVAALLGLGNLSLIGVGVFMSSFIPVIGAAPVTYGLALQQFFTGHKPAGIILLISAVIVTAMDNVIRPWFLKGSANLHPLLAFVAAFGGLQTLGFAGIFLGPILAGLFVASLQILSQRGD